MSATMHAVLSYEVEQTWCVFFLTGEFTALELDLYARLSRANLTRSIDRNDPCQCDHDGGAAQDGRLGGSYAERLRVAAGLA